MISQLSTRAAFRAMTVACGLVCTGCAGVAESPRAPYAVPASARSDAEGQDPTSPAAEQKPTFLVAAPPEPVQPAAPPDSVQPAEPAEPAGPEEPQALRSRRGRSEPPRGQNDAGPAANALSSGRFGLFATSEFELATGRCTDCGPPAAALWWFDDELVAVPRSGGERGDSAASASLPTVVWLGAPQRLSRATLSADAKAVELGARTLPLAVTPPLATNAAYVDASTVEHFNGRPIALRGNTEADELGNLRFVARTIFPEDDRLELEAPTVKPLAQHELLGTLIEAQALARQRLLFARSAPDEWPGKPVIALVLSGAQGDDDGARAGHLALATGVLGPRGEWRDWLVTNFYPLLEGNAKGIIPASLPIDNYLYGLNSGQLYYRPGYMLVAVLRRPRAAIAVQRRLQDTMLALYCGRIEFDRARRNSTAMIIDPLRELGWRIPAIGPTSRIAGLAAAPAAAVLRRSFGAARAAYATFAVERTRLLPRVAFEVAGHDLLHIAAEGGRPTEDASRDALTPFERMLAEDVEALLFVRLAQVPSARRPGTYPVASLWSYGTALLADPAPYEGAPEAEDRVFPEPLRRTCGAG